MDIFFSILLIITIKFANNTLLFKIKNTEPYCLGGEYNANSILILKYKIFTESRKNITQVLPYLAIHFNNVKSNKKLNSENIFTNKGKFTFAIKEEGSYETCIQNYKYSVISNLKEDLYVNFKINSDDNDEEDLFYNAINNKDIDIVTKKANKILKLKSNIINNQEKQIEIENEHSLKTLTYIKIYKYLTFVQLIIIIIVGVVHLLNFKKFLKSQNLI